MTKKYTLYAGVNGAGKSTIYETIKDCNKNRALEEFSKEYELVVNGNMKNIELIKKLNVSENTYFRYVRELNASKKEKER